MSRNLKRGRFLPRQPLTRSRAVGFRVNKDLILIGNRTPSRTALPAGWPQVGGPEVASNNYEPQNLGGENLLGNAYLRQQPVLPGRIGECRSPPMTRYVPPLGGHARSQRPSTSAFGGEDPAGPYLQHHPVLPGRVGGQPAPHDHLVGIVAEPSYGGLGGPPLHRPLPDPWQGGYRSPNVQGRQDIFPSGPHRLGQPTATERWDFAPRARPGGYGQVNCPRYEREEGAAFYLSLPAPWNVVPRPDPYAMQEMSMIQRHGFQRTFSGDLDEYPTFRQLFIMTQHQLDVPLAMKYMGLAGSLRERAKICIKDTLPSAQGYSLLIRRLEERFGGEERHMIRQEERLRKLRPVCDGDLPDLEHLVDSLDSYRAVLPLSRQQ